MRKTYLESSRGSLYTVSWADGIFSEEVLGFIVKWHQLNGYPNITVVLGHGSNYVRININHDAFSCTNSNFINSMYHELMGNNVTGIRVDSREESILLEQEILKGYEWSILKK